MATPALMVTQTRGIVKHTIDGEDDNDGANSSMRRSYSSSDLAAEVTPPKAGPTLGRQKSGSLDDWANAKSTGKKEEYVGKVESDHWKGMKPEVIYCHQTRRLLVMHAWPRKHDIKKEVSLVHVRVVRKHPPGKKPGLEVIAGETGDTFNIFIKPDTQVTYWYDLLRKERVNAVRDEEARLAELPAYMRNRARASSNAEPSKKEARRSFSDMVKPRSRKKSESVPPK